MSQIQYEYGQDVAWFFSNLLIRDGYQYIPGNPVMTSGDLISQRNRLIHREIGEYGQVPIPQSRNGLLEYFDRAVVWGAGNASCINCAALAGVRYIQILEECGIQTLVEFISNHINSFIVVNRNGNLQDLRQWGADDFIIDVWHQNQFPNDFLPGVFWADDLNHPLVSVMIAEMYRGFGGNVVLMEEPERIMLNEE